MSKQCQCDELRTKLADMICRYNNDKNTFYKAPELDGALREVRKIAREADMDVIVSLIDQVLGKEQPKPEPKKDDGQMDLYEVLPEGDEPWKTHTRR